MSLRAVSIILSGETITKKPESGEEQARSHRSANVSYDYEPRLRPKYQSHLRKDELIHKDGRLTRRLARVRASRSLTRICQNRKRRRPLRLKKVINLTQRTRLQWINLALASDGVRPLVPRWPKTDLTGRLMGPAASRSLLLSQVFTTGGGLQGPQASARLFILIRRLM